MMKINKTNMKFLLALLVFITLAFSSFTKKKDSRYFELRVYYSHPKLSLE